LRCALSQRFIPLHGGIGMILRNMSRMKGIIIWFGFYKISDLLIDITIFHFLIYIKIGSDLKRVFYFF